MKKLLTGIALGALLALPVAAADLGGRVINIGSDTTYPPHEFIEDGVVKGFDVDVVAEICKRINCQPNWITTAWDGIFGALADGQPAEEVLAQNGALCLPWLCYSTRPKVEGRIPLGSTRRLSACQLAPVRQSDAVQGQDPDWERPFDDSLTEKTRIRLSIEKAVRDRQPHFGRYSKGEGKAIPRGRTFSTTTAFSACTTTNGMQDPALGVEHNVYWQLYSRPRW